MTQYICSKCGKEKDDKKDIPKMVLNFRNQNLPICSSCDDDRVEEIKKQIKTSAKVILPGGAFGV